jgi:iron complex outermembrane receptor protein
VTDRAHRPTTDWTWDRTVSRARRIARVLALAGAALDLATALTAADASDEETLEPVVVTAPREAPDAQRTPASVTAFTPEQLDAAGIEGTRDVPVRAPNLVLRESGDRHSPFFSIRGVVNANFGEPSVSVYVDGVPITDLRGPLVEFYDVERVEVYRGPQATRFGRNAEAGAISVTTRPPGEELSTQASVHYGTFDTLVYQGAASGPLGSDRVRFSLAGLRSQRDGYVDNTLLDTGLDDRDLIAGRGTLLLLPLPELEVTLTGEVQHADDGGKAFILLDQPDPFEVRYNTRGRQRTDAYLAALKIAYAGRRVRLTSITARQSNDAGRGEPDLDFSPLALAVASDDHAFASWTQEVRLASADAGARWRWEAGTYFEHKDTEPNFGVRFDSTPLIQAPPPVGLGLPFTAPVRDRQRGEIASRTFAGFGESTVALLERLELTIGLRFEHYRADLDRTHVIEAPAQGAILPVVPPFERRLQSSVWLPHGTLAYRLRPSVLAYATVARGYRPGGFSPLTDDPRSVEFDPQFDLSHEVGLKTTWLDERLLANLALFYVLIDDYQVIQRVGLTGFTVVNADAVTSRGVELELAARPADGLDLAAGFGYTDARFDDFRLAATGARFDGNDVQLVPQYNFALAGQYRHRCGALARVEYLGLGAYSFLEDNRVGQDAYELLNARLGWEGERFGIYAFGRNLADAEYFHFGIPGGPGGATITTPGDPRTFGVMALARF